jgi:hypothetical protein
MLLEAMSGVPVGTELLDFAHMCVLEESVCSIGGGLLRDAFERFGEHLCNDLGEKGVEMRCGCG